jgi:hypothetical protein
MSASMPRLPVTESAVLSVALPTGDPASIRSTARSLDSTADRLAGLGRRGVAVLDADWAGEAAEAAADRTARLAMRLLTESLRCHEAAEALWVYATRLDFALDLAADARRLLEHAYATQQAADLADPAMLLGRSMAWSGAGSTSYFADPQASLLVDRARRTAWDADSLARRACRDLVAELNSLSGVTLERRGLSPRLLVDLAGFVPVVGDAIDAANGLVYLLQGDTLNAGLSLAAVLPGPLGWGATSGRIGKSLTDAEVIDVVLRAADPLQARHIDPDFVPIYRDRDRLITKAVESTDQTARPLVTDIGQLEKKYKHASQLFDLPANGNPRHWPVFEQRMREFADAASTVRVTGTYRGEPAILYVDSVDMRRVVMARPNGDFWSAWSLSPNQARYVWERHALQ